MEVKGRRTSQLSTGFTLKDFRYLCLLPFSKARYEASRVKRCIGSIAAASFAVTEKKGASKPAISSVMKCAPLGKGCTIAKPSQRDIRMGLERPERTCTSSLPCLVLCPRMIVHSCETQASWSSDFVDSPRHPRSSSHHLHLVGV